MPALPDLGRVTVNGIHMLNGKPITETEIAKDPIAPVREDNIKKLLETVFDEPVMHTGLNAEINLNTGRVHTFDAVTNEDMKRVVKAAIATGKKILWVGTAGIVDNLIEVQYPAVALVASLSQTSREQVLFAEEKGTDVVVVSTDNIIGAINNGVLSDEACLQKIIDKAVKFIDNNRDVIIISAATYDRDEVEKIISAVSEKNLSSHEISRIVQMFMGQIMSGVLERARISGIFVSGGDTAFGLMSQIGVKGLHIISEVLIGIPLMRIFGGEYDGIKIITKAGAFGQRDALTFCMRKLKEID